MPATLVRRTGISRPRRIMSTAELPAEQTKEIVWLCRCLRWFLARRHDGPAFRAEARRLLDVLNHSR